MNTASFQGRAGRAVILVTALLVLRWTSACGGAGIGGGDASRDSDADVVADVLQFPDTGPGDTGHDFATTDKADHGAGKDAASVFPLPIDIECEDDQDCSTACGNGKCEGGSCRITPISGHCLVKGAEAEAWCYAAGQSDQDHACLWCNPRVDPTRLVPDAMDEGFEEAQLAFTPVVKDLSGAGVTWNVTGRRAYRGGKSLYLGDPELGTYGNGKRVASQARFNDLALPGTDGGVLAFFLFMETEATPGYDVLTVGVEGPEGEDVLFSSDEVGGDTGGSFIPVRLPLPQGLEGRFALVFTFDTMDDGINSFEGVYVDDIRVGTDCCGVEEDCDDRDPCTLDSCPGAGVTCMHEKIEGCCMSVLDCNDSEPCTSDSCPVQGGSCLFEPVDGCCHDDQDCDDGDECTLDACPAPGGQCTHVSSCCETVDDCRSDDPCMSARCVDGTCEWSDVCCHSDMECDDGDPCTLDSCQEGACEHDTADIPGCCVPDVFVQDFDAGAGGFEFTQPVDGVGWHVVQGKKYTSEPGALYYGNPETGDFDNGQINTGTATSPSIFLQDGYGVRLVFELYMDTESSDSYDKLTVYWKEGDKRWPVWKKPYFYDTGGFHEIEVDLSAFAGREGSLEFEFDTVDDTINHGEGVYIDDIEVRSTCEPVACLDEDDCDDDNAYSEDSCISGICAWELLDPDEIECESDWDCDDYDWCTYDYCIDGKCVFEPDPWCW